MHTRYIILIVFVEIIVCGWKPHLNQANLMQYTLCISLFMNSGTCTCTVMLSARYIILFFAVGIMDVSQEQKQNRFWPMKMMEDFSSERAKALLEIFPYQ